MRAASKRMPVPSMAATSSRLRRAFCSGVRSRSSPWTVRSSSGMIWPEPMESQSKSSSGSSTLRVEAVERRSTRSSGRRVEVMPSSYPRDDSRQSFRFRGCEVRWAAVSDVLGTKGERTRARLLDVAVRRFAVDGFRRTSVAAVAEESGVTAAAVYAYFPGKEGLFEAAVDADAAALISEASAGIDDRELVQGEPRLLPALVLGVEHHGLARRVLAGQESEVIDRLLAIPALIDLRHRLAEAIAAGQEAGRVRADIDAKAIAVGLETVTLALLMARLKVSPEYGDERRRGVEAVFRAVLRPPPGP